jgi:lipopolysaccharide export system ATP-binding protein
MTTSGAVLVARGLCVTLAGRAILRGIDLEVRAGEIVGVLGPCSAGKSTLFRALAGEALPAEGTIALDGSDVTREPLWRRARRGLGYMPQTPSVLWGLTVGANLDVFRRVAGLPRQESHVAAARVGLGAHLGIRAGELSGAERRRLELARALTRSPRVLLCDEPFAGIDRPSAQSLGILLRQLAGDGTSVLLADHPAAEALGVCTRAVLLLDGVIAAAASASEFADHPLVRGRYPGTLDV